MRALVVHNFYRSENASGENLSVLDEISGLRQMGWDVEVVSADSDVIGRADIPIRDVALRPIWSTRSVARVRESIERFRPHVALVENLFPLHSPAVIRVLRRAGVPVAAGVRSYRMYCVSSTTYRDGRVCTECVATRANLPAVRHGCYQNSAIRSIPMAISLSLHRSTFSEIDCYLAVSEFVRDELVDKGFDARRIVVRPNFVDDPGATVTDDGDGFLLAGRLTADKGTEPLLQAWARSEVWREHRLRVAGSGPGAALVDAAAPHLRVEPLGLLAHKEMMRCVRDAAVTVVPSQWPEPFGRSVVEAAAHGRPSLVTDVGGLPGLVEDGTTGWVTTPDVDGLVAGLRRAAAADRRTAGAAARRRYERQYTREVSLGILDAELRRLAGRGRTSTNSQDAG